ncbi:MAG TPA: NADH:flavin oxidoreductase/NADH oxidase [Polyangiaceae bacterium]|jgi:2,4-dienoyl-CoA reductase-like NADH-dependent reductase (Old Yellow Enzyme family)|nr:NADH:flavin oxidoreductase/NADH oxidase [Polyangiaceae bacterium]
MAQLFDPLSIRGVNFKNRIAVSPMCQYSARDGFANDWHLVHLGSRAVGGAALVVAEATAVEARGRISPSDLGLWQDAHIEPLARIVRFLEEHGAVAGIQIAHAGRKAATARPWEGGKPLTDEAGGWDVVGASPIPFDAAYRVPHELSVAEIAGVREQFGATAKRALQAGFRYLELHAAHGYLLHSFLSPLSNQRSDAYGGSLENRARFLLETVRELRAIWPKDRVLGVRLSCTDWVPGGWTIEDTVQLAPLLEREDIDLIDCSAGGSAAHAIIPTAPGYQVGFAEAVKRATKLHVAAVGLITEAKQANAIIAENKADFVFLARQFLRDPYFAINAARELGHKPAVPPQYGRAH